MTITALAAEAQDTLIHQVSTTAAWFILGTTAVIATLSFLIGKGAAGALKALLAGGVMAVMVGLFPTFVTMGSGLAGSPTGQGLIDEILNAPTTSPATASPSPTPPPTTQPDPAPTEPIDWTWAANLGIALLLLAATATVIAAIWWALSRRRAHIRERNARRQTQIDRWNLGLATLNATSDALAEFEFDKAEVYFNRPLLGVLTEPASAEFYDAYATAVNLKTDNIPVDDETITTFVNAATKAHTAFTRADENARSKASRGIIHDNQRLNQPQRRKLEQARKLMAQATDASATPDFAHNAHTKALDLLDEVGLYIPTRLIDNVTRSIEATHRAALPAGAAEDITARRRLLSGTNHPNRTGALDQFIPTLQQEINNDLCEELDAIDTD